MRFRSLFVTLGCLTLVAGGCGSDGETGPQGPAGPQGPQGPSGADLEVGPGLSLTDGVLGVRFGTEAGTAVAGNDPRLTDLRLPAAGSADYIQNGTTAQAGSFSISGTGSANGQLLSKSNLRVDAAAPLDSATPLLRLTNTTSTPAWNQFPLFTVDAAGGLVARGELGNGPIPATGKGYRLMWYPNKAAFRAGSANGAEWDDANIGFNSWAGGNQTTASGYSTFAFGDLCAAGGTVAVCFGSQNTASGTASFTTGASSVASGFASLSLGYTNVANGQGSVALGYRVNADGDYTMALGHRVSTAGFDGSFIWGDQSTTNVASSTANNQFMVRASGGVRLRTNATLTTGCDLPAGSGVFNCTSDRNTKEDFRRLDGEEVLAKVARMPVESWRYKEEAAGVRHVGPVAQDFHAAFGLGTDDRSIGMLDIDGVNMAAIQALEKRTQQLHAKTAEVDALKAEMAELKSSLQELRASVRALGAKP